jgi:membrane protein
LSDRVKAVSLQSQQSTAFRAYLRFKTQRGSRLAAAITYFAFLSLFPLLAISVAITAAVLGEPGVARLRSHIERNLPGLGSKLPLDSLVANAATLGVVSGVILLWSGLSWVNAARGSLRTMWAIEDNPGTFVRRKLTDLVSLFGLGLAAALSIGATASTTNLAARILRGLGIVDTGFAEAVLGILGISLGIVVSTVMFAYLLVGIPRLRVPRGVLLRTALVASLSFEVAKVVMAVYLSQVASRSIYGAFGTPVAVLLWFDLTFQGLLYLSAWTATRTENILMRSGAVQDEAVGSG